MDTCGVCFGKTNMAVLVPDRDCDSFGCTKMCETCLAQFLSAFPIRLEETVFDRQLRGKEGWRRRR